MVTVEESLSVAAKFSINGSNFSHNHQQYPCKCLEILMQLGLKLAIFVAENKNLTNIVKSGNKIQIFAPWLHMTSV